MGCACIQVRGIGKPSCEHCRCDGGLGLQWASADTVSRWRLKLACRKSRRQAQCNATNREEIGEGLHAIPDGRNGSPGLVSTVSQAAGRVSWQTFELALEIAAWIVSVQLRSYFQPRLQIKFFCHVLRSDVRIGLRVIEKVTREHRQPEVCERLG